MSQLAEQLAGMQRSALPVWVIDVDHMRIRWANARGLEFWRVGSVDELLARDLSTAPEIVITRTRALMDRLRRGAVIEEEWTFYPDGVPLPTTLHLSAVELDDGRLGMLNQVLTTERGPSADRLRGIEALRHIPVIVALVGEGGDILMQNPSADGAFGDRGSWLAWFEQPDEANRLLELVWAGEHVQAQRWLRTLEGERLHEIGAVLTKDPVSGDQAVLVFHSDETERASAQRTAEEQRRIIARLDESLALVERQRNEIIALSAPLIEVGERRLAVPLIGDLSEARGEEISRRLLDAIVTRGVELVIFDLTGARITPGGVSRLVSVMKAIRLLGARSCIAGVQPRQVVALSAGGGMDHVTFARSLAEGLASPRR